MTEFSGLAEFFRYLAYHGTKALTAFIQRDSFLYWPFLLSAAVVALAAVLISAKREPRGAETSWRAAAREFCSARVWWHPSARADYRLYMANALLLPAIFAVLLFSDRHVVDTINSALGTAATSSSAASAEGAGIAAKIVFTILFFVAYDLGRFIAHSLLHDVPILWEFHKVHHSAETLTPMTTFRAHPVDLLVMAWVPAVVTGGVTWAFNQVTGTPVSFYTFLGLHVLVFSFNLIGLLRHSNVWLTFGPMWGRWFISPAHHQLHHSCEEQHLGCNRGFELAVWDRLYGTLFVPSGPKEPFRMGCGDGTDAEWHAVSRMYYRPFVNAAKRLGRARRPDRLAPPPSRGAL